MNVLLIIAINEFRLKTSRFRKHRTLYLSSILFILLFWAMFFGPYFFDLVLPEILRNYQADHIELIVSIIEYSIMMIFLFYFLYPLYLLYQKEDVGEKEFLLAAPIHPGKIFLGRLLGQMPLYFLLILGLGPVGSSLLLQLNQGLDPFRIILIYLTTFGMLFLALLFGGILAEWVEMKIKNSDNLEKQKNLIFLLISTVIVSFFYLFHFIFQFLVRNPVYKNWLFFYPGFWFSYIILFIVDVSFTSSYLLNIYFVSSLVLIMIVLLIFFSNRYAEKFYDIYPKSSTKVSISKQNKSFSWIIEKTCPNKWKKLVTFHFHQFFRKKEFRIRIIYSVLMLISIGLIIHISSNDLYVLLLNTNFEKEIIFDMDLILSSIFFILSWSGGFIFGLLMSISELIESKEVLNLYKRSPLGLKALILPLLLSVGYLIIVSAIIITGVFLFVFQPPVLSLLLFFLLYLSFSMLFFIQSLGFQFINPLFENKGKGIFYNIYSLIGLQVILFIITIFISISSISFSTDLFLGFIILMLVYLVLSLISSVLILYFGYRNLLLME